MPYKSENIKIEGTKFDKRIKLSAEDKELVKWLHEEEQLSTHKLAERFGVSRRTIQFILDPAKLEQNKLRRKERGGSKIYYDKDTHAANVREHRRYKQDLKNKGLIK